MIAILVATGVLLVMFGTGIGIATAIERFKWRKR